MNKQLIDKDLTTEKKIDNLPLANESAINPDDQAKSSLNDEDGTSQNDKSQQSVKDFLYKDAFLEGFIWE